MLDATTKRKIARVFGVDQSYISNLETGKQNLTFSTIKRISDALEAKPEKQKGKKAIRQAQDKKGNLGERPEYQSEAWYGVKIFARPRFSTATEFRILLCKMRRQ